MRVARFALDRPDAVRRLARDEGSRRSAHSQGAYLEELASAYAPAPIDRKDPLISPLFANLSGFPPTLIQVGSSETLLDDAVRFARVAGLADVTVTLQVWPHMIHAWAMWNAKLTAGREALEQAGEFMQRWVSS